MFKHCGIKKCIDYKSILITSNYKNSMQGASKLFLQKHNNITKYTSLFLQTFEHFKFNQNWIGILTKNNNLSLFSN